MGSEPMTLGIKSQMLYQFSHDAIVNHLKILLLQNAAFIFELLEKITDHSGIRDSTFKVTGIPSPMLYRVSLTG